MKKFAVLLIIISFSALSWACDSGSSSGGCGQPQPDDTLTVTGPVTGGNGRPQSASILDLAARGYVEEEYFFQGAATSYELDGEMTRDGKWTVSTADKASFKTRMLVRRPVDAAKFNGTVMVEWLNVSAGADGAASFVGTWQELLREGYAWVGVSAQAAGVVGAAASLGGEDALPLIEYDPDRYGSLNHPGDAYAFDIFTLAAKVVRGEANMKVLGELVPQRLLASGVSQSAVSLVTYVNGVHPMVKKYDGYFIQSRMAAPMPIGGASGLFAMLSLATGDPVLLRTDIDVPVFQLETESDVFNSIGIGNGFNAARQPDTSAIRTWEVAGSAHMDKYAVEFSNNYNEVGSNTPESSADLSCGNINDGPLHFVVKAAFHHLNRWVAEGVAPPTAEPLAIDAQGQPITDEHGNAIGGVRTPDVDVPVATLSGLSEKSGGIGCDAIVCGLLGSTKPFTPEKLLTLYPTHDDYVAKVTASARQTREAGFILAPEEQAMVAEAQTAPIPN